jgi:hypothetical protein
MYLDTQIKHIDVEIAPLAALDVCALQFHLYFPVFEIWYL